MAEVVAGFGLAGSIVQCVDFSSKLIKRLGEFESSLREANNTFSRLALTLPLVKGTLDRLESPASRDHLDASETERFRNVLDLCTSQARSLEESLSKTIPKENEAPYVKRWKALCSLAREKSVKRDAKNLHKTTNILITYHNSVSGNRFLSQFAALEELMKRALEPTLHSNGPTRIGGNPVSRRAAVATIADGSIESGVDAVVRHQQPAQTLSNYQHRLSLATACLNNRFWSYKLPSIAKIFSACDRTSCKNRSLQTHFRVSLSRLGILRSIELRLGFGWGESGLSTSFMLRPSRIVRYTSPGFEVLRKCMTGLIEFPEARTELLKLFDEGRASIDDVDPSGATWLEKLIRNPWSGPKSSGTQFQLLEMLLDYGAKRDTEESLLYLCVRWIGEAPHMYAAQQLLSGGYDVSLVNSQSLLKWPQGLDSQWISEDLTPDPLFLDLIRDCVNNDPGFGDTTPLMRIVLLGSEHELDERLLSRSDVLARNFIGQSALHLAIARPQILHKLVPHYETVDVLDRHDITPLMYTAAYGETKSAIHLLEKGANPLVGDQFERRNFLDYARARNNWDLIFSVIEYFQSCITPGVLQAFLSHIILPHTAHMNDLQQDEHFQKLFDLGADPNCTLTNGETLLHLAQNSDQARLFLEAGFTSFNQADCEGITPLMKVVTLRDTASVQQCLDRGAFIESKDVKGWTVLHHAAVAFSDSACSVMNNDREDWYLRKHSELVTIIRLLLNRGADPAAVDSCPCACSGPGCTPTSLFLRKIFNFMSLLSHCGIIWTLEWLQILLELASKEAGEQFLLGVYRSLKFKDSELTHVCCRPSVLEDRICYDEDDIDEILDEQAEIINEVEKCTTEYAQNLQGSLEENLIAQISAFGQKIWDQDTDPDGAASRKHSLPRAPETDDWHIDDKQDEFVSVAEGPALRLRDPERLSTEEYVSWLDYYYLNRTNFSTPSPIDEEWYTKRKFWASRLQSALDGIKSSYTQEYMSKLGPDSE